MYYCNNNVNFDTLITQMRVLLRLVNSTKEIENLVMSEFSCNKYYGRTDLDVVADEMYSVIKNKIASGVAKAHLESKEDLVINDGHPEQNF